MLTILERELERIPKVSPGLQWQKAEGEWFPAFQYKGHVNYRSQGAARCRDYQDLFRVRYRPDLIDYDSEPSEEQDAQEQYEETEE
jgi:hypothetical protein